MSSLLSTPSPLDLLDLFERSRQPLVDIEGQRVHGVPGWDLDRVTAMPSEARGAWLECVGYAGSFPAPCGDECIPVDLEEDEDPARYRYRCPETFRWKYVSAQNAAVYAVRPAEFLGAVADLLTIPYALRKGIESPAIDGVLWQLGRARIGGRLTRTCGWSAALNNQWKRYSGKGGSRLAPPSPTYCGHHS
jgi:hypothetical protein